MPTVFNEADQTYVRKTGCPDAFTWHTSDGLAERLAGKQVRMDIRSLDPGTWSYPYHFHHGVEEVFVVLAGEMSLRTPEGIRTLRTGDVVFCEMGASGAHQLYNHTETPCRYLDLTTFVPLDVCEYPDTDKVLIRPEFRLFEKGPDRAYFEGEEDIAGVWERLREGK